MNDAYGDMPRRFAALAVVSRVAEPEGFAATVATSLATTPASFMASPSPVDCGRVAT